jgi:hypothetical protein
VELGHVAIGEERNFIGGKYRANHVVRHDALAETCNPARTCYERLTR